MPGQNCSPNNNQQKGREMVIMDKLGSVGGWYLKAFAHAFISWVASQSCAFPVTLF